MTHLTQGSAYMAVQGSVLRHDVSATVSTVSKLPVEVANTDTPLMVNAEILSGLLTVGITAASAKHNALAIRTRTGLKASLPVAPDPHRVMALRIGANGVEVEPALCEQWLRDSVSIAKSIGTASSVYTYRSQAFVFNKSVLVAARLPKGWPVPNVSNARQLANILSEIGNEPLQAAQCSDCAVLVTTSTGKAMRVEAPEQSIPQQPIDMMARFKSHNAPSIQTMDASALRDCANQFFVVAQAFGFKAGTDTVSISHTPQGLTMRWNGNKVNMPCESWTLGHLEVDLRSLITLRAIPTACEQVEVISAPQSREPAPLVLRAGNLSFFMASIRKES